MTTEAESLKQRLALAYLETGQAQARVARLERELRRQGAELAEVRRRLERYEPTPEVEISTFGT